MAEKRFAIQLANNDLIASKTSAGKKTQIISLDPLNTLNVGSKLAHLNLITSDDNITLNGTKKLATKDEIQVITEAAATIDSLTGTPSVEVILTDREEGKLVTFNFSGLKGPRGDAGKDFSIYKTYSSIISMMADAGNVPEGSFVLIASTVEDEDNAKLYVRTDNSFSFITDLSGATGIKGEKGDTGATPNISVTANELPSESNPTVSVSGEPETPLITFGIPKGKDGTSAKITSANATVDSTSGNPSVTVSLGGTELERSLQFAFSGLKGIQGDKGEQGIQGEIGPQGPQGPKGDKGDPGTGLPSEFELIPEDTDLATVIQRINEIITALKSN